jgi:hypothetical protein
VSIVSAAGSIRGTITLSTRLDPDEGVLESISGVCGWAHTKAGADQVAPVTPGELGSGLDTVTCCEGNMLV